MFIFPIPRDYRAEPPTSEDLDDTPLPPPTPQLGQGPTEVIQDPIPCMSGDSRSSDKENENYSCDYCDKKFNVGVYYAIDRLTIETEIFKIQSYISRITYKAKTMDGCFKN